MLALGLVMNYARNLNLQSDMQKNHFETLTSDRVRSDRLVICDGMPWGKKGEIFRSIFDEIRFGFGFETES